MTDPSTDLSSRPSRPELAGLFGGVPDRSASLQGLLSPTPGKEEQAAGMDQPAEEDQDEHRLAIQATQAGRGRPLIDRGTPARMVGVAVYLPDELAALLRRTARTREMTYGALTLEAVRVHQAELSTAFRANPLTPNPDELFAPIPPAHRRGPGGRQVQLRLARPHAAKLQELAHSWGAGTRSALVAEALRLHLGQPH